MEPLTEESVRIALNDIPGWIYAKGYIGRDFRFADFNEAFAFLTRIAMLSEKMNHHANWSGVYNQVNIRLSTHSAGGITQKDLDMAQVIQKYAE